jgi:hypothetical protein
MAAKVVIILRSGESLSAAKIHDRAGSALWASGQAIAEISML